jgi:hypothetical protein
MNNLNMDVTDPFVAGNLKKKLLTIPNEKLENFYDALFGSAHTYAKPMDRINNIYEKFTSSKKDELFAGTRETAKAMYDKFYTISCEMYDYLKNNRNANPIDRCFFLNQKYSDLKNATGEKVFSDKEIYVLKEMGYGEFLLNVSFYGNTSEAIDKIEHIIKGIITKKYLTPKNENMIENKEVKALVGSVA